ncbi:uncharacterized protein [Branchiostoma lanceolatum]|uniref:uncharacterized protein isoform X2 n=1 Tax=Branchiostoma lanceolatum TaxID=7740 RepID=UPI003456A407
MSGINMTSLADKLQDLELCLKGQHSKEHRYGRALREAILCMDISIEVEVLKSLGDWHLQKGKRSKDSTEFDKAAALYAAALLRCTDLDMGQTLEHRVGYMEKLSRQLLQGYTPLFRWLSPDYWGTTDSNVLRVAETCEKLDRSNKESQHSVEETYTETLVTAIENSDMFLEVEILKSLGNFYLEQGKKAYDVSQFSKSTAMYRKALTRREDPETKQTLHHRISYAEKIRAREAVRQLATKKQMQIGRRPSMRQYKDHLKKGESLTRSDLDSSEQHFAAALKAVHIPDPTAQQYQREVEPLRKMGDVYSKRGQQTGDGGDFVKAAALYNAAIARSEDQLLNGNIAKGIEEVEKSFLKSILDIHCNVSQENTQNHKKQLKVMRDQIKLEIETIDQQLDPYAHDEDDPCVKEIEAKRGQAVRQLFEKISQQRKEFISLLVEECIGLMGPPPCKFALIGLGSQATGLVTPYSDLEFAILVEEESKPCLLYFRNLTHYLHLKVVNLGETILPALGIKSLNDFYSKNPLDNWYYDSVTPRGFAFDGSMPMASKTPLGRQGTMDKPPSELICTPNNMVSILQNDVTLYLQEGYHLASILRNPCLIAGDQNMIDTYMAMTEKILRTDGGKIAQQLAQETQRENIKNSLYNNEETITARLINVKKELYRFPSLAVDFLAMCSHIKPTTIWKMIEEMKNKQVISSNNAHHLTVLTSISAELRLKTYIANGGQKENFSALASMEAILNQQESSLQTDEEMHLTNALKPVFHLSNEKQLFRYYHTAVPLKSVLSKWSENSDLQSFSDFYDTSPKVQGHMYHSLCKYRLAMSYYHEALKTADGTDTEDTMLLLCNIGTASFSAFDSHKAIRYYEQALKMHGNIHGQSTAHPEMTSVLNNNLGEAWTSLGEYKKAIRYHEHALQMLMSVYGPRTQHNVIADTLQNLGVVFLHLGDYRKAISYFEQALQMNGMIYGEISAHPDIARLLNSLGVAWSNLGEHRKAVSYHDRALQMWRDIYGSQTVHPDIASSFINLGGAFVSLGKYRKGISHLEQALQILRGIYGQSTSHPYIASVLSNLGVAWGNLGEHMRELSYYEQALQMHRSIYGPQTAHPDIANSLSSLGAAWYSLGKYRKAVSYNEQALEMSRSVHGHTAHPHIATALNSLGTVWSRLGEHGRAVSYYEQSLLMFRGIYGQTAAHPDIATLLDNLGKLCVYLGEHRRAASYIDQALQMRRNIYGPQTAHPDIASSLNNLGMLLYKMGDFSSATCKRTLLEALAMAKQIYPDDQSHPLIKTIEMNLNCP